MVKFRKFFQWLSPALIALCLAAGAANAGPDDSGSAIIHEDAGFPGLCTAPCYSVEKSFEFWLHDNPNNPLVSATPSHHTYVYKLEHLGGSSPVFVPGIIKFRLDVDETQVSDAGYILGSPGVVPSLTAILTGRVEWSFEAPVLLDGETTALLYVHSHHSQLGCKTEILSFVAASAVQPLGQYCQHIPLLPS